MKSMTLGPTDLSCSVLSLGCMRMAGLDAKNAAEVVDAALECGIDFFDHADIYGGGDSEAIFARALEDTGTDRSEVFLQSKCGIQDGYYDFSKDHILSSVDGGLERLRTEYLDVLLLHRPDALMEPEEVAAAFSRLKASGKVRHFGVSNQNPSQMELLRRCLDVPLVTNQLQLGIAHCPMIDQGIHVNTFDAEAVDRENGVLDYCRLHDVTVQAWSPLQAADRKGVFLGRPDYDALNRLLEEIALARDVPVSAVALAWLLRHPAGIQPVVGSMTPARIRDMCRACEVDLTRPEWYRIYIAAGKRLP